LEKLFVASDELGMLDCSEALNPKIPFIGLGKADEAVSNEEPLAAFRSKDDDVAGEEEIPPMLENTDEVTEEEAVIFVFEDTFDVPVATELLMAKGEVFTDFLSESPASDLSPDTGNEMGAPVDRPDPN